MDKWLLGVRDGVMAAAGLVVLVGTIARPDLVAWVTVPYSIIVMLALLAESIYDR